MSTPRLLGSLSIALLTSLTVPMLGGCSDIGTHMLAITGSEPVTVGGLPEAVASSDGWMIVFTSFVVVLHDPGLIERTDNDPAYVRELGVTVWDVVPALAEGEELSRKIRATRYDGAQFRIAPTSISAYDPVPGNVDQDVVDAAADDGWSVHVVGIARPSGVPPGTAEVTFDWTFDTNTFYRCKFEDDEVVELAGDAEETTTIEILGEVLFREEADNADAVLVFQPIVDADANGDSVVTADELEAAGLLDTIVELTHELGGIQGAGACPEYEAPVEG
jgi:hypothetical protein